MFWDVFKRKPALVMPMLVIGKNDAADRLQALQIEQRDVTGRLIQLRAAWAVLAARTDPASHLERSPLASEIAEEEARAAELSAAIALAKEDVRDGDAKVAEYTRLVEEARAFLSPVLARLPSDAEMVVARDRGRRLSSLAADLLAQTGDRQFRRVSVDPFFALRDALVSRLEALDRIRHVRADDEARRRTS